MNLKLLVLLGFCSLYVSCKSNFKGKKLSYDTDHGTGFQMVFINDSILEVYPENKDDNSENALYKYNFLGKKKFELIRENQPSVNFKTKKLYGQFYQKIAIKLLSGKNSNLKKMDTLHYIKIRTDGKMTKRIYFNNGNNYIRF